MAQMEAIKHDLSEFNGGTGEEYGTQIISADDITMVVENSAYASTVVDRFEYKGDYSNSTTYYKLNRVGFNGETYEYINDTPSSGHSPTDTTYWLKQQGGVGGYPAREILELIVASSVTTTASYSMDTKPILYDTELFRKGGNKLTYNAQTGKIRIPANSGYSFVKITANVLLNIPNTSTTNSTITFGIESYKDGSAYNSSIKLIESPSIALSSKHYAQCPISSFYELQNIDTDIWVDFYATRSGTYTIGRDSNLIVECY